MAGFNAGFIMEFLAVYISFANMDEAKRITDALLDARLAACANLMPCVSVYWWGGEKAVSDEVRGVFKTKDVHFDAIKDMVLNMHSYEVPCVVGVKIERGHEKYLNWIDEETA